jgi:hypothetical protein
MAVAGRPGARPAVIALGASLVLNAIFLATYLSRQGGISQPPAPAELLGGGAGAGSGSRLVGAPSTAGGKAGATLSKEGTTQLADMYTAPLHLMKSLIDNALKGAGYGAHKPVKAKLVAKRQKSEPAADPNSVSMNAEVAAHKVVDSTGAFFDPSLKAFVNPLLLPHLAEMNELQTKVFASKLSALKAADRQIANPTSAGKPVPLREPADDSVGLFQWGSVNPVNHVMRLDCTDSVMDASSNGAPKNRLWGSHFSKADMVDACGPGDECRDSCAYQMCNEGAQYTVECPPGCAARAGPVFGGGTAANPFLDASSVCGAAVAQGIARNDAPTILTLKIVNPVRSYRGETRGASAAARFSREALQALEQLGDDDGAAVRTTLDFEWREWER